MKIQNIVVINQFYDNDSSLYVRFYSQISSKILSSLTGQSKRKEKAITHFIWALRSTLSSPFHVIKKKKRVIIIILMKVFGSNILAHYGI